MKKLIFLLSVSLMIAVTACGKNDKKQEETVDTKQIVESTVAPKNDESQATTKSNEKTSKELEIQTNEPSVTKQPTEKTIEEVTEKPSMKATEQLNEKTSVPAFTVYLGTDKSETEQYKPVSYDPYEVVRKSIAKCQKGGMITTEDNLMDALKSGQITREEYDEYYPFDGLEDSYYSVFVNVDLNKAYDIVGNKYGSVDAIADHIAGMMLLESEPVFNISYAGITALNGEEFYEFRCHR